VRYPLARDFRLSFDDLTVFASGLNRPECVLALSNGELLASHGAGGYSRLLGNGAVQHVFGTGVSERQYVPNGIALAPDGRVLFADLGSVDGGIFVFEADGGITPLIETIDGELLPPCNFVLVDADNRIWFTVSTRQRPRSLAWNPYISDGFIGLLDAHGPRIVADGLGYANEVAFSPDGRWLYVNETYAQRISRFQLRSGSSLGEKEIVARLGDADLPDGLTFDSAGGLWVTCIASNRLIVLRPEGDLQVVLEDTDPDHASQVSECVRESCLNYAQMQTAGHSRLGNISSLAFGGTGLKTAFLGCLLDDKIRGFTSPVEGARPLHWHRRLRVRADNLKNASSHTD
jgi:sugar lactone lactonase YvrE